MANEILAASTRPCNYNLGIYSLILASLKKYCAMSDGAHYDISPEIDTLVGLGFTAVMLVDRNFFTNGHNAPRKNLMLADAKQEINGQTVFRDFVNAKRTRTS